MREIELLIAEQLIQQCSDNNSSHEENSEFRVEAYRLPSNMELTSETPLNQMLRGFVLFEKSTKLAKGLFTLNVEVLRRYTKLSHHLPVHERSELSFAGLFIAALLEQHQYAITMPTEGLLRDYYLFIHWLLDNEPNLNDGSTLKCTEFPEKLAEFIKDSEHPIDRKITHAKNFLRLTSRDRNNAFNSLKEEDMTESFPQAEFANSSNLATPATFPEKYQASTLFYALSNTCENFLGALRDKYSKNDHCEWNAHWEMIASQLTLDLAAMSIARPKSKIPSGQLQWLHALTPSVDDENNSENPELFLLAKKPSLIIPHDLTTQVVNFTLACCAYDTESHDDTPHPTLFQSAFNASSEMLVSLLFGSARLVMTPLDIIQLAFNQFKTTKTPYLSAALESAFIEHKIFTAVANSELILPKNSYLTRSIQPLTAELFTLLSTFGLPNFKLAIKNLPSVLINNLFGPSLTTLKLLRDVEAEQSKATLFNTAIQHVDISAMHNSMNKLLKKGWEALPKVNNEAIPTVKTDDFSTLAREFLIESAKLAYQSQPLAVRFGAWELGQMPGVTSYMPAALTHEFTGFLNNSMLKQRGASLLALAGAVMGLFGVPVLHNLVDSINHSLTGKSFHEVAADDSVTPLFMAFLAFQGFQLITSIPHGKDSTLIGLLKMIVTDPLKIGLGMLALNGLAMLQLSTLAIDSTRFLSCDVKLSKTGLLVFPEQFIRELFEARYLASFPYILYMLIMFKSIMILTSFVNEDHCTAKNLSELLNAVAMDKLELLTESDNVPINPLYQEWLKMAVWREHSGSLDLTGRITASWYQNMVTEINKSKLKDAEKEQIKLALYRQYVQGNGPVSSRFIQHAINGISNAAAYLIPVVPETSLVNEFKFKWNWTPTEAWKPVASALLVGVSAWWLFIYKMERDGNPITALWQFILNSQQSNHESHMHEPSTHTVDRDFCLSGDLAHHQHESVMHHLVTDCMAVLTSCQYSREHGNHDDSINAIWDTLKLVGASLIALNALMTWMTWNSETTRLNRNMTKAFWVAEGSRGVQVLMDSVLTGLQMVSAIIDFIYQQLKCSTHTISPCTDAVNQVGRRVNSRLFSQRGVAELTPEEMHTMLFELNNFEPSQPQV